MMLKSYSGDTLNVVAQLLTILGHGDQEVSLVVLVASTGLRVNGEKVREPRSSNFAGKS